MENQNKIIVTGVILGVSIIIATLIGAGAFLKAKGTDNVITVSGSAKQQIVSDSARWTGNFSRTVLVAQMKDGYAQVKSDEQKVKTFFANQGFKDVEISPVFMNEIWRNDPNTPQQYNLIQNVSIKSSDVNKVKELAKNSDQLAAQGVIFSAGQVEYYYSKLPELRVSLLPEAIKDAKKRADVIAESSGKKVDAIKSVVMGVVQLMPIGTMDVSDYGAYDTSEINKDVMITVKTIFSLK